MSKHTSVPTQQIMTPLSGCIRMALFPTEELPRNEARRILSDIRETMPEVSNPEPTPDVDFEDFWEAAFRVSAAAEAARNLGTTIEVVNTPPRPTNHQLDPFETRLGSVRQDEQVAHRYDPLALPPVVQKHGGRRIQYATIPELTEDNKRLRNVENNIFDILLDMHANGAKYAVVKLRRAKAGIITIPLSDNIGALNEELFYNDDVIGWAMLNAVNQKNAVVVQEWIPMDNEYRFFIVDGEIVTGAATIEEHTPFNREYFSAKFAELHGNPYLDNQVRRVRENSIRNADDSATEQDHMIRRDDALVHDIYAPFINDTVIPELIMQGINTVVVDVATKYNSETGRDEPLVIELNAISNSGFYACDPYMLMRAIISADDRGYKH